MSSVQRNTDPLVYVRPEIRTLHGYTPGEQDGRAIKLNTNECAWPPSPSVKRTLAALADNSLRQYPDPVSHRLRASAAALYGVSSEQILVGNGSDDCLTILYRTFLAQGDRVACPWPTYGLYDTLAALQGAPLVRVDYRQTSLGWELPAGDLAGCGAKLTIVANPNNPSGTMASAAELRRLADSVSGILVVDEAYIEFAIAAGRGESLLPHLSSHPNLVVLRTFSKAYSLAGARLGFLFAAAPLVREMNKVKDSYNVNVLTQALGVAALEDRAHHDETMRRTLDEKARLEAALAALGWTWPPSGANFLLCSVGPRAGEIYRELKARGILVRWWNTPELRERLRITVGRPDESDALLRALATV